MLFFSFDTRNNMEIIYVNWGLHICNNFIWTFCDISSYANTCEVRSPVFLIT